jgi:hypothetical protein
VKIFEGDLIKREPDPHYGEDDPTPVEYITGSFCVNDLPIEHYFEGDIYQWEDGFIDFEVIGNIHDNPEMLRKTSCG